MPTAPSITLALHFIRRDLRSRYLGSFSGGAWALVQPLIQLGIYAFVYVYVFRAPAPAASVGIVPFLALGLWPWIGFADALQRATNAVPDNAALIGKVALPRELLVIASVSSSFLLHGVGFLTICLVLRLTGAPLALAALPLALLTYLQLFVFTLGLALVLASVQVFVRDLAQVLAQILQMWMFATPVLYPRDFLPEQYRGWMSVNPLAWYVEHFRALLLGTPDTTLAAQATALLLAALTLAIGFALFRRLSPHFEDFL